MARGPIKKNDANKEVLRSFINFRSKQAPIPSVDLQPGDVMFNSNYIKQSSALISDALQKGFDVLQMANGDIVTTGTKTVVYKYTWENDANKLKRTNVSSKRGDEPDFEEDVVQEALADVE